MLKHHIWLADEMPELQWSLHYHIDLINVTPRVNGDLNPIVIDGDTLVAIDNNIVCRYNAQNQGMQVLDMQLNLWFRRPDESKYMPTKIRI